MPGTPPSHADKLGPILPENSAELGRWSILTPVLLWWVGVLISGVGLAAIQLVREAGALPYATASADKHRFTQQAGAEASIDYKAGPWLESLRQATGGQPIDVVVDCVGASYYAQVRRAASHLPSLSLHAASLPPSVF